MREKTVAEWKAKVAKAENYAEKLEVENRELKELLEQTLTERSEVDVEKVIILGGLRDLANTSKYHTNAEWKRIVMRLTENAEDYANRVLAEARERTKTEQNGVDVDALLKVAKSLERFTGIPSYSAPYITPADCSRWARTIRDAVKGANPSKSTGLPEGVIWPRFEDGELVKFGDEFTDGLNSGPVDNVEFYEGQTLVWSVGNETGVVVRSAFEDGLIKRPEPDTFESILSEMVSAIECEDCVDLDPYIKRYRKLQGGESHE